LETLMHERHYRMLMLVISVVQTVILALSMHR
jgi:hypothetical protein